MNASVRLALEEARRRLEDMYGERLMRVVLYGSQARGDAREDSDVDVLVILRGPVDVLAELKRLTDIKLDLMEQYDEYVSFQPFSEEDYQDRGRPLMMNVHAEGLELWRIVDSGRLDPTISKILPFAADARQHADYDAFTVFDEAAAADLIADAQRFVEAVEALMTP